MLILALKSIFLANRYNAAKQSAKSTNKLRDTGVFSGVYCISRSTVSCKKSSFRTTCPLIAQLLREYLQQMPVFYAHSPLPQQTSWAPFTPTCAATPMALHSPSNGAIPMALHHSRQ
jgi:hypothetical protein